MKSGRPKFWVLVGAAALAAAVSGGFLFTHLRGRDHRDTGGRNVRPIPVETAPIQLGPIALERTFSGELEALAEFIVAPKVGGRVTHMGVNIADTVARRQVVAELDNDEYVQAVQQARADLAVARATLSEARSTLEIARREFKRTASLLERGIASDSEFDAAKQDQSAKEARLAVAAAQVTRAGASLETARIRLRYTRVTADWTGGDRQRVVAERFVDEGQTVAANGPLLRIVELHPIVGVVFVAERDYARLKPGQPVSLETDAYPSEKFTGRIDRIAPVFRQSTRQARVEITVDNTRHRLKPGMFIRATVVLDRLEAAVIVPEQALTRRDDGPGVFVIADGGSSVAWRPVVVGIRQSNRVQVAGDGLTGQVVVLGQQLVKDGSTVKITAGQVPRPAGPKETTTP